MKKFLLLVFFWIPSFAFATQDKLPPLAENLFSGQYNAVDEGGVYILEIFGTSKARLKTSRRRNLIDVYDSESVSIKRGKFSIRFKGEDGIIVTLNGEATGTKEKAYLSSKFLLDADSKPKEDALELVFSRPIAIPEWFELYQKIKK